jgi:hypothetical protein
MPKQEEVLINILTRTSNRPVGFKNCRQSVVKQTYKNVKHFVTYETDLDLNYIKNSDVIKIKVQKPKEVKKSEGLIYAPYNLYCNELLSNIDEGWILFLDDDNNLLHNRVLEEIVSEVKKADTDTIFIWQMRYPNGYVLPLKKHFREEKIEINNIDTSCFIFHSKYKDVAKWDEWKASDFRFLKSLFGNIPNKKWIEKVYIQLNNYGDYGNRNDILKQSTTDLIFKKNLLWYLIPKYHTQIRGYYIFQWETYKKLAIKFFRK